MKEDSEIGRARSLCPSLMVEGNGFCHLFRPVSRYSTRQAHLYIFHWSSWEDAKDHWERRQESAE